MRKRIYCLLLLLLIVGIPVFSQDPPPPPPPQPGLPIDRGLSLLLALGALYGVLKLKKNDFSE